MRPCLECGTPTRHERCARCGANRYGKAHQAARRAWAPRVTQGRVRCARCGELIAADDAWHLDHVGERSHPAHARCNIGAPD